MSAAFTSKLLIPALTVVLLTPIVQAQESLRVDVRLVTVTAAVSDLGGKYINDLKAEDFLIQEDGVSQKISHFTHDPGGPLSVGIIFDLRNTMRKKLKTAIHAADYFVRAQELNEGFCFAIG